MKILRKKITLIFWATLLLGSVASCGLFPQEEEVSSKDSTSASTGTTAETSNMTQLSDTIYLSTSNKVVFAQVSASDYAQWQQGFPATAIRQSVTQDLYEVFRDDFDFIFLVVNEETKASGAASGVNITLRNDVTGIGISTYDDTQDYGASGTLRSLLWLAQRDSLMTGPALHEIAHNWANFAIQVSALDYDETNFTEDSDYFAHWGYSSVGGQLGGFDEYVDLGNNEYQGKFQGEAGFGANANGGNALPYADLELYLMGLLPKEDVEDITVFTGLSATNLADARDGKFTATSKTIVTIDDIIADKGARVPAYPNSQTEFSAVMVVLDTSVPTDDELLEIEATVDWFSEAGNDTSYLYNFYEATGGRATIDMTDLDQHLINSSQRLHNNASSLPLSDGTIQGIVDQATPLSGNYHAE